MPDTPKPPGTPTVPSSAPSRRGPVLIDYGTAPGTAPGTPQRVRPPAPVLSERAAPPLLHDVHWTEGAGERQPLLLTRRQAMAPVGGGIQPALQVLQAAVFQHPHQLFVAVF